MVHIASHGIQIQVKYELIIEIHVGLILVLNQI
ncbi:hypothetical protein [Salmonella phage SD-6_S16]|nr:hypothetical protein [Salmonella phage SD-6_S16]